MTRHARRHAATFALLFATFVITTQGVGNWWPAVFMRQGGLTPTETGAVLGIVALAGGIAAAVIGGLLSDWATRRDPATGRLKLVAVCLAGQLVLLLPLLAPGFVPGLIATLSLSVLLSGIAIAACYALLPDLVPPEGRGLIVAMFQFIFNLIGFGFGPTAVALVTNQVLNDESRVADAMLLFGLPLLSLAVILASLAVPFLRRMRAVAG